MKQLSYQPLDRADTQQLLAILNKSDVRDHLIEHALFNEQSLTQWIRQKQNIDSQAQYLVQAVYVDQVLAGWCGLQPDDDGVELAIVLDPRFWGVGPRVFQQLLAWAKQCGHKEVLFHLLDSRKAYPALARRAIRRQQSQLLGRQFLTYYFAVK